jgi:putative peptidoglycan lipid II flippase
MGAAAAVSRILGGGRVLVVAAILGTTYLGDTFEAANTFPTVVFELLAAGALSAVLVPTFVDHFNRGQQPEAERQAGGLLGLALVPLGALTVLGILAAPWLADLLTAASDGPPEQQELATVLLRWFLPQLCLYALGTVAIAVLNARRVFALTAAAPIANTVVVVTGLILFWVVAGPAPGLDLSGWEQAILGLTGTLGVAAYVAIPAVALRRRGFRLRPRWTPRDAGVLRLLRLSVWAVLQHTGAALLLGASILLGAAVEGGVIAYRVAFHMFLAPYGIFAQPIHATVQPELASDADRGDLAAFGRSLRWASQSLAVVVLPVAIGLAALAVPIMEVLAFGQADRGDGVELMAAGVAGLALGLPAYGGFRLLAVAWYSLDDSRTPALAAISSAVFGVVVMLVLTPLVEGSARIFVLGVGHTLGFLAGTVALGLGLHRRYGVLPWPRAIAAVTALAVAVAALAWWAVDAIGPDGRWATALCLAVVGAVGAGVYYGAARGLHLLPGRLPQAPVAA